MNIREHHRTLITPYEKTCLYLFAVGLLALALFVLFIGRP